MKHLKIYESFIGSKKSEDLYQKMSELLDKASNLYFEVTGDVASFNNPDDAIKYLSEYNKMIDVKDILDEIKKLNNQINEIESDEFYNHFDED